MLAQSFKTAIELGLSEKQHDALIKTLALLDGGKLEHARVGDNDSFHGHRQGRKFTGHFNMARWRAVADCGTVCCIAGTAELIGKVQFDIGARGALGQLFTPGSDTMMAKIRPDQAAMALRSYLTTGNARWDLALAD